MTLVVDASVVVAPFVNSGDEAVWCEQVIESDDLAAPHLLLVETANTLRRLSLLDRIAEPQATDAHFELLQLPVQLFPYEPFAQRVWQLRRTVTPYDAWYVAIAEWLDAPLATLDRRLTRAFGPRCKFLTPPD